MRRLCIVAHGAPMLYGYLIVALEKDREGPDPIEIVVDRRRAGPGAPAVERRKPSDIDREIATRGFVVLDENGAIVQDVEPPAERRPAWRAQALHARDRIETAWRSLREAWRSLPPAWRLLPAAWQSSPALPSVNGARDRPEAARRQSLSTVNRAREGLRSRWQSVAAMAQALTPEPSSPAGEPAAPEERGRFPRRPRKSWMLGGAVAAVLAAAVFVALEPPDPPDPVAARETRPPASASPLTVAAVDGGPRAAPSQPNGSPPASASAPSPAFVTPPAIVAPSAAVETPTPEAASARPEPARERAAAVAAREASPTSQAEPPRETPASPRPATASRETPASPQTVAVRDAPPPRHAASARSEAPTDAKPSGPPRVELQSDAAGQAEARTITYTARLSDARGRPLVDAEVSLHGWLPDGSDLKARLTSTSTPGVYRASVPVGPRTPSNLRVLVAHGGKRFEVAPQRRAF